MRWLTSLPSPVLVAGWLVIAPAIAALSRVVVHDLGAGLFRT